MTKQPTHRDESCRKDGEQLGAFAAMKGHQRSRGGGYSIFNMICIYFLIDNFTFFTFSTCKNTVCVEIYKTVPLHVSILQYFLIQLGLSSCDP